MLDFIKDIETNFADKKAIDFSLDGIKKALEILGNPEKKLQNVIHVAGTNGKGSVVTFLHSILTKSGYKVHKYTSPHIEIFNERITIYNRLIIDEEILQIKDEIWNKIKDLNLTYFEVTTVIAFCAFVKNPADFVILETGLGGRLDATNVFEHKLFSVITSISLDHQAILGETLSKIAAEKMEIIKGGKYCVSSFFEKNEEILEMIEEKSEKYDSKLYVARKTFLANGSSEENFNFKFNEFDFKLKHLKSGISGLWQIENASIAIAVCAILSSCEGFEKITQNSINIGILSTKIKGRMTELNKAEMQKIFPKNTKNYKVILDIAHNIDGITKLCQEIAKKPKIIPKIAIFSQLKDKKNDSIYEIIAKSGFEVIYCLEINSPRKLEIHELESGFEKFLDKEKIFPLNEFNEIFTHIKSKFNVCDIYIFGSNFLVADFYSFIKTMPNKN